MKAHKAEVKLLGYITVRGINHPVPTYAKTCTVCGRRARKIPGRGVFWHSGGLPPGEPRPNRRKKPMAIIVTKDDDDGVTVKDPKSGVVISIIASDPSIDPAGVLVEVYAYGLGMKAEVTDLSHSNVSLFSVTTVPKES